MKNNMQIFVHIIYILFIILLIYCIVMFFKFSIYKEYEIKISQNNKEQIIKMLEKESIRNTENIDKVRLKPLLGDARLFLYSNSNIIKDTIVVEGSEIMQYVLDNGEDICFKYIMYIIGELFMILIIKSCKNNSMNNIKKQE